MAGIIDRLKDPDTADVLGGLSILIVEDVPTTLEFLKRLLERTFRNVFPARDGCEALEIFTREDIDMVLTDHSMPEMTGLELVGEIRKENPSIPVIMITAMNDADFLIKAINMGITQFVTKPFQYQRIAEAVEACAKHLILENLKDKAKNQEIELLQYREKYHSRQQEQAKKKELHIIKNDLGSRKLVDKSGREWLFSVFHRSVDILCGDSYGIRRLNGNRVFAFVVDAMGKGVSASVTTVMTVSMLNHLVDEMEGEGFSLQMLIDEFMDYIKKYLLPEEILCGSFLLFDFDNETLDTARFSMPKMFIRRVGACETPKSGNPPITKHTREINYSRFSLGDVHSLIVYTDGLTDTDWALKGNNARIIEESLCSARSLTEMDSRLGISGKVFEDDCTVLFVKKHTSEDFDWSENFEVPSRISDIGELTGLVSSMLLDKGYSVRGTEEFAAALTEILLNAHEHGNLAIGSAMKERLVGEGEFDSFVLERERNCDKIISLRVSGYEENRNTPVCATVVDQGEGFSIENILKGSTGTFSGRGLKVVTEVAGELYFNSEGNEVTFIMMMKKGDTVTFGG
ncbi:fused response regulator/phosphatase [Limisalsivibrio acetivorans]|uniref:fused response regulator/phosphatase n=1 Tax=Limisalsivibrio acetivorans TaxID=1304888 RepID=UPI0003B6CD30|nr:fused response regulator/phosphatase [Limisalsivibrio acetivorans]